MWNYIHIMLCWLVQIGWTSVIYKNTRVIIILSLLRHITKNILCLCIKKYLLLVIVLGLNFDCIGYVMLVCLCLLIYISISQQLLRVTRFCTQDRLPNLKITVLDTIAKGKKSKVFTRKQEVNFSTSEALICEVWGHFCLFVSFAR